MDYQNILSNEFRELDLIAKKQKENYISAYPFPHITVRNFFSNDFLNQVLDSFRVSRAPRDDDRTTARPGRNPLGSLTGSKK